MEYQFAKELRGWQEKCMQHEKVIKQMKEQDTEELERQNTELEHKVRVLENKLSKVASENFELLQKRAELEEENFQHKKSSKAFRIVEEVCTPLQTKDPLSSLEEVNKKTIDSEAVCSPLRQQQALVEEDQEKGQQSLDLLEESKSD